MVLHSSSHSSAKKSLGKNDPSGNDATHLSIKHFSRSHLNNRSFQSTVIRYNEPKMEQEKKNTTSTYNVVNTTTLSMFFEAII